MKAFAKMARAIRNTSNNAHVPATANFLDAEFSDNSGRAARVLSSQFAWKRNRFKKIANKAAKIMEDRVRLFNKGDAISDEAKKAKLKRESKKSNDLFHLIYRSDVGREGAKYFEQLLQQKKIVKSLNATISGEISVEKAQKMIAKAIEVQKKADAARAAKLYKAASSSSSSRSGSRREVAFKGDRESYRPTRARRRNSHASANRQLAGRSKASGCSGASKRAQPLLRAPRLTGGGGWPSPAKNTANQSSHEIEDRDIPHINIQSTSHTSSTESFQVTIESAQLLDASVTPD